MTYSIFYHGFCMIKTSFVINSLGKISMQRIPVICNRNLSVNPI